MCEVQHGAFLRRLMYSVLVPVLALMVRMLWLVTITLRECDPGLGTVRVDGFVCELSTKGPDRRIPRWHNTSRPVPPDVIPICWSPGPCLRPVGERRGVSPE